MYDHVRSIQATNQANLGIQSILNPKGSGITVNNIAGMNFISYQPANAEGGGKPEPLQLTMTPPEVPQFRAELRNVSSEIIGLNEAIKGNPPPGVTAASAIATLSANAQEFLGADSQSSSK